MPKIVTDITQLIGQTPVVKLGKIVQPGSAEVCVKLERFNPSGSVKDRAAFSLIAAAERQGLIKSGATVIEPTSGNTGIGLAMNAAAKGYNMIVVMPDNMSLERINLLKAYGAEVVLTPAAERMPGAISKALELQAERPGSFIPNQFENAANPDIHRADGGQAGCIRSDSRNGRYDYRNGRDVETGAAGPACSRCRAEGLTGLVRRPAGRAQAGWYKSRLRSRDSQYSHL
jgi:cysteine synthase A